MSLLLTLWLACAPSGVSEPAEDPAPLLIELGTGEWEWAPLEQGEDVPVIQGPQGGFHLLGSVRVSGVDAGSADDLSDPRNPTTTFSVLFEGANLAPSSRFVQGLDVVPAGAEPYRHEMIGRFIILDITADDELDGVELELSVKVEDVDGEVLEATTLLSAYPHALNL
ncbi:MAG: hypothetical protein P8N28_06425 [Phycisphaerales bacterium]|nr:hypothetical protein [Phycisphaerales bacterium]